VQVLTTGSWPTQAASKCVLPAQLESACATFGDYYHGAHSGRRLTWQTNMGTADLKATFNDGKVKHEITVRDPGTAVAYRCSLRLLFSFSAFHMI
jgi:cullin 3